MQFNIIGSFEIVDDNGAVHSPGMPKVCQTLAVLLTRPGEIVGFDCLIQELWGDNPPRRATTTFQTYIYYARRMFVNEGLVPADRPILTTHAQGYLLDVREDQVDIKIFERLVSDGRRELEHGDPAHALDLLHSALALWRGPALGSIHAGRVLQGRVAYLEELRLRAYELRIEAQLRLGLHREAIPQLRELVSAHPLNEWFHHHLIHALHRSGRRAEALQAYQSLRGILREELGVEPSADLQDLYLELLGTRQERRAVAGPRVAQLPAHRPRPGAAARGLLSAS
ncbi:AfsR/SARP family transcriptional regulator [Streptomyces sp. MUM 203J]|uniref:AfsR/SARP family transcriptional regulator n=1 Tax=Streptomyces sp. MUM 203J TaxID=2791990 RepID=UPI001F03F657|nr:AfsR/SARP family transcriptional regulator [Streptomyces sp. MUM 203J]MCH0540295.1 AfsR/SARP family transcriptional regulator [Streptomyces sp. MUM 203J]